MIKTLFIYWAQKFKNAPEIVQKCLLSWKINNPTWTIIELDDTNLYDYINLDEIKNLQNKNITKTSYSDIVRIFLLNKYGGCWCDATTFCNKPLDCWLYKNIQSGFFAFNKPTKDRMLSSWFLYSEPNNYIVSKWKEKTIEHWNNNDNVTNYFWFHHLFGSLYKSDTYFQKIWDLTPKISADLPHYLQNKLFSVPSNDVICHINGETPMYKLTYKFDTNKYNDNCVLKYLYDTTNLTFIHIGKCGGTTIVENFKLKQYHLNRNYLNNEKYIIWIRHPLKRFVSAFNHAHYLINNDTSNLNINNLSLDNCFAPMRIQYKMTHDHTFSLRYDYLINYFGTSNCLAESLTSDNLQIQMLAIELMNSELEHINNGIGWYLFNGKFVEDNYNKIIFVGSIENMNNDILKLSNMLNKKVTKPKIRENKNNKNTFLSEKAISNLLNFYKDTDYKALQKLVEFNFISTELYESYFNYVL